MSEPRKPLVVIGVPCYGTVAPEVLSDWFRLAFHLGRRVTGYNFQIAIRTKSEQFRARNSIVEAAQQVGADYLLFLDDDMIVDINDNLGPNDSYNFLPKLLSHGKDIVGALYYQRQGECAPVAMMKKDERGYRFMIHGELTGGLQRVDVVGGGCMLINMKVFDFIKQPHFAPEFEHGTDVQLCRKAAEAGFEIWLDSSIELGHLREERTIVTSKNRTQFSVSQIPGEVRAAMGAKVYDRVIDDAEVWTGIPREDFAKKGSLFHKEHAAWKGTDEMWYRQFPQERVVRQVWFNNDSNTKRQMTEFILNTVMSHNGQLDILDFGCGIGLPAFTFAEGGHRVTATDLEFTGPYLFLQWRAKFHGVNLQFAPIGREKLEPNSYDVIVAMDCLEHLPNWREVLKRLAGALRPGGVFFANNAVLDDTNHPEHYELRSSDFMHECVDLGLVMRNEITFYKQEKRDATTGSVGALYASGDMAVPEGGVTAEPQLSSSEV